MDAGPTLKEEMVVHYWTLNTAIEIYYAGMTEEEPYDNVGIMSALAGVMTCLTILYAFYVFSGVYGYEHPFVMMWFFSTGLYTSMYLWLDVGERKEKISNRWVRNSKTILGIAHIMFGLLVLLNILLP